MFNCLGNLLCHLIILPVAIVSLTTMQEGKKCLAQRFGEEVGQTCWVGEDVLYIDVLTLSIYHLKARVFLGDRQLDPLDGRNYTRVTFSLTVTIQMP
jgi:hypothetical protein